MKAYNNYIRPHTFLIISIVGMCLFAACEKESLIEPENFENTTVQTSNNREVPFHLNNDIEISSIEKQTYQSQEQISEINTDTKNISSIDRPMGLQEKPLLADSKILDYTSHQISHITYTSSCNKKGVIEFNNCGWLIKLDEGTAVYPYGVSDFDFQDGKRVRMSFEYSDCATHPCMMYAFAVIVDCIEAEN